MNKVFGLGLSKTGTQSLSSALNILDIKSIHYPRDNRTIREVKAGRFDWQILKEYQGIIDLALSRYYRHLDRLYPGSKFVLTVRDKESWLESVESHWKRAFFKTDRKMTLRLILYGCCEFNRDHYSDVYDATYEQITGYFRNRPGDLLVMNICDGDGWEVLCPFLGKPVPSVGFPRLNVRRGRSAISILQGLVGHIHRFVGSGRQCEPGGTEGSHHSAPAKGPMGHC
jgi:hypothetical protein